MRINAQEIQNGTNIYEVFQNKLYMLTDTYYQTLYSPHKKPNTFHFNVSYHYETKQMISTYQKFSNILYQKELLLDIDDMFLHIVYERSKKVNPNADIFLLEKSILIEEHEENRASTLIMPCYMKLDREDIKTNPTIQAQIAEACHNINKTEKIKQIYLVYPKHPNFKKYIGIDLQDRVTLPNDKYRVKMIPYSFSFCTKNTELNHSNIGDT